MDIINKKFIFYLSILLINLNVSLHAEEDEILIQSLSDQIKALNNDIKTLEKAVYQKSDISLYNKLQSV